MRKTPYILLAVIVCFSAACGNDDESATESAPTSEQAVATADDQVADTSTGTDAVTGSDPESTEEPAQDAEPFDETRLQELLLDAQPGDVIEIPAGTYSFDRGLSLDVDGVTIRGAGSDETILSFADQLAGAEGLLVSASDFTIEHLAIEDTPGDALKVNEGENIVIRGVRTEWTGGYATDNGAYGIYPVQTTNVLIEDSIAIGASDAGIYVGQSNNIIVRNNLAEFNVAGIEIENSIGADVYGNVTSNNTGGILIFNLPGLSQRGSHTRVYNNTIVANNTENFAPAGSTVSVTPAGSGVVIMANDQVEVFENTIEDNRSSNIIVASSFTVDIDGEGDPIFDGYPEGIYIHDNQLSGGGNEPDGILAALKAIAFPDGDGALPSVVWDGATDPAKLVNGELADENRFCVQQPDAEVINADASNGFAQPTIDNAPFDCTLEPLPSIEIPGVS